MYSTRHGSSEKVANILKDELHGEVTLHNLKKKHSLNTNDFDALIVGGSIHAGEISARVKKFVRENHSTLLKKHLGLYICCMDKEKAQQQFENAYDDELRASSAADGLFGGEFIIEKMNWFEKLAVKKIAGVNNTVSNIDHDAIKRFAEKFNLLA